MVDHRGYTSSRVAWLANSAPGTRTQARRSTRAPAGCRDKSNGKMVIGGDRWVEMIWNDGEILLNDGEILRPMMVDDSCTHTLQENLYIYMCVYVMCQVLCYFHALSMSLLFSMRRRCLRPHFATVVEICGDCWYVYIQQPIHFHLSGLKRSPLLPSCRLN